MAWETSGQGDVTRRAVPLLRSAASSTTNKELYDSIVTAFGAGPRQNSVLLANELDARRTDTRRSGTNPVHAAERCPAGCRHDGLDIDARADFGGRRLVIGRAAGSCDRRHPAQNGRPVES
jgi:hypothetical protein